jgi:hypothetical protein
MIQGGVAEWLGRRLQNAIQRFEPVLTPQLKFSLFIWFIIG